MNIQYTTYKEHNSEVVRNRFYNYNINNKIIQ